MVIRPILRQGALLHRVVLQAQIPASAPSSQLYSSDDMPHDLMEGKSNWV